MSRRRLSPSGPLIDADFFKQPCGSPFLAVSKPISLQVNIRFQRCSRLRRSMKIIFLFSKDFVAISRPSSQRFHFFNETQFRQKLCKEPVRRDFLFYILQIFSSSLHTYSQEIPIIIPVILKKSGFEIII